MKIKQFFIKHLTKLTLGVAIFFFLLAGSSFFLAKNTTPLPQKKVSKKVDVSPTPTQVVSLTPEEQAISTSASVVTLSPTQQVSTTNPTPTNVPQQAQNITVALSVNGSSVGQISLEKDKNQCDVLQSALSQGKIASLNMRYDNSLGTFGVYQINGQGKDNVIWWTYTVNGQSPTQGCSYIKANNNDNIDWKYIGS